MLSISPLNSDLILHVVAETHLKFQQYMCPMMMAIHVGNHQVMHGFLLTLGCKTSDVELESGAFYLPNEINHLNDCNRILQDMNKLQYDS